MALRVSPDRLTFDRIADRLARFTWRDVATGAPVIAYVTVIFSASAPEKATALLVGLALIAVSIRRPSAALVALVGLIVFNQVLLALALRLGVPVDVVDYAVYWKEALLVGIVAAALSNALRENHTLDVLDRLALGFCAVCTVYLLTPELVLSGDFLPFGIRQQSFRVHVYPMLIFVAARHLPFDPALRRRLWHAVLVAGGIVAALAVYEFAFSSSWNSLVLDSLELNRFKQAIYDTPLPNPTDIRFYDIVAGQQFTRVGSIAFDPVRIAFYFCLPFAIALESVVRGFKDRPWVRLVLAGSAGAIVLTFTRSAILAGLVTTFAALRPSPGRTPSRRARLGLVVVAASMLALPWIASSGLGARTQGAVSGADSSTIAHFDRFNNGLSVLESNPWGLGLGAGPSVANRGDNAIVNAENSYLLVGDELGVIPMVMFTALLVLTVRRLGRVGRGRTTTTGSDPPSADTTLANAMRTAGIGLLIGGFFLHVWIDLHTSLTFWGCAGLALGVAELPVSPRWQPVVDARE